MLTKPQVKLADDCIKDAFLRLNQGPVGQLIQAFTQNINNAIQNNHPNYHLYLKGGNAISALSGAPMTGDFDFQMVPDDAAYQNWNQTVADCDTLIFTAFNAAINAVAGVPFDVAPFILPPRQPQPPLGNPPPAGYAFPRNSNMYKADFDYGANVQSVRRNCRVKIGQPYANMTYTQIINDHRFDKVQQRLLFTPHDIQASIQSAVLPPLLANNGPMYYVNYTIPGFILYRLVYSYEYTDNNPALAAQEHTYILKSEIIDVSVPRKGSGEVHISQDHVITHFRPYTSPGPPAPLQPPLPQGVTISIPGWGYHLYEAITLIQEIELGISGSPHKRQKRLDRGRQALHELLRAGPVNMNVRHGAALYEPCPPNGLFQILNYIQALTNNVDDYGPAIYDNVLLAALRNNLDIALSEHLDSCCASKMPHKDPLTWAKLQIINTAEAQNKRLDQELEYLCKFRINTTFDQTAQKAKAVWGLYGKFKCDYNSDVHLTPQLMLGDGSIVFISPFKETGENTLIPMNYAVAAVTTDVFNRLFKHVLEKSKKTILPIQWRHGTPLPPTPSAFAVVLHGTGFTFRIAFQRVATLPNPADTHLSEILKRTIIQSQRYALVLTFQS